MPGYRDIIMIFCLVLAFSLPAGGEEDIEDLIDIAESGSKLIAIIKGVKRIPVRLLPDEKVLWRGSSGDLGAFLTDTRFFVISTSSASWQVLRLKVGEREKATAVLSPNMALLVTDDRAVGYHVSSKRFIEVRFPLKDELLAAKAEKQVAVVVTSSRVFALAEASSSFIEARLRIKEIVEDVKVTSSKAVVHTSDRLLSFVAGGSRWREHRLD